MGVASVRMDRARFAPGPGALSLPEVTGRAAVAAAVPLVLARQWNGKQPYLDDSLEIDDQPCGICAGAIAATDLVRLRVQSLIGPIRAPLFDEESVPVHAACLQQARAQIIAAI